MKSIRSLALILTAALAANTLGAASPAIADDERSVTVMTRNVYPGVDDLTGVILAVLDGDFLGVLTQVEAVWQQVRATDFPARSSALADEIATGRPILVGLQEVALWRSQLPADFSEVPNADQVEYDFVELLLTDLRSRGLHYEPVAVSVNFDLELPRLNGGDFEDIRWTDRDVLLARTDLPSSALKVLSTRDGRFETFIDLGGGLAVPRGWVSADVKVRGGVFRVVSAHLEDMNPDVNLAQASELLGGPIDTPLPTILLGDFNSDANDATSAAYHLLVGSGLADAWSAVHPGDPGLTCCQAGNLLNDASLLYERPDLVLFRGGFSPVSAVLSGDTPEDKVAGLWPSDHAGVTVQLVTGK